ncbi:4-(cytidine 5'-diphospho)-2-C-methyl-D-erythritol kinase [Sphingobium sp. AN641]|uniref:4-(cytidine 5'-diphospho)-2-C-methyl-D-erythritol kinase n=1 Tax=Sphingobium sp. AN641 TaxID=3133443 RepID=UPI0030BFF559
MPHPDTAEPATALLTETAFAKINIALHVRARRADGYHELDSLFAFAEHGDVLRGVARGDDVIALTIDGPFGAGLDAGEGNLVVRAARALAAWDGGIRGADLHLTKNLPVASGIGGGSADAAAALRLLIRLWDIAPAPDALHDLALALGSDVPACLASATLRVGGRGDQLAPAAIDGLAGAPILLVNPRIPVATGPVFAQWDGQDRGALDASSLKALVARGRNDLEPPAMRLAPMIGDVLAQLRGRAGVRLARMSGSGATCFALFDDDAGRDAAGRALAATHPHWWTMATRIRDL